jgi:hypothetical protein
MRLLKSASGLRRDDEQKAGLAETTSEIQISTYAC